jgi:ElaB/YqjD/DUF883 family membrane-anchored ribosome-binding protein
MTTHPVDAILPLIVEKDPIMATTKKTDTQTAPKPTAVPMNSDISSQLDTLRNDIMLLAKTVKEQALTKVESRADTAKTVATEQKDAAVAKYDELAAKAEQQIREKPLTSMAWAVGAGVVLGALLRK